MFPFIPYPEKRILTRQERLQERLLIEQDLKIAKSYWFFIVWILIASCIVWILTTKSPQDIQKERLASLHSKICEKTRTSDLCTDASILERMHKITEKKGVPIELVIGIAFAESSNHTNYNKPQCKPYNNLWGLKWYKTDTGKTLWYDNSNGADSNWCWLYKFDSIEQGTEAISNTLAMGYKWCKYDTRCISYNYVGNPNIAEESWIGRVSIFYTPKQV